MKIVNWNIEWMNNWFEGNNQVDFRNQYFSRGKLAIADVRNLAKRVAQVILNMNPDVLTVQEGPSDLEEMELFVSTFLSDGSQPLYRILGPTGKGAQKLYALVKNEEQWANASLAHDEATKALEEDWLADVDGDLVLEEYGFTRQPLVMDIPWAGDNLRIVVLHTKSKFVQNQQNLWDNENRRMEFIAAAMKNRRRISAEGFRLRQYLDQLLVENANAKVVVTGDWNDGPGNDFFERHYLTHNVSDIILGSTFYPENQFYHSFLHDTPKDERFTAVFDDFIDEVPNRKILLDHIVVSPALVRHIKRSGVDHVSYGDQVNADAPTHRERAPSDHRPIFIDLAKNLSLSDLSNG